VWGQAVFNPLGNPPARRLALMKSTAYFVVVSSMPVATVRMFRVEDDVFGRETDLADESR